MTKEELIQELYNSLSDYRDYVYEEWSWDSTDSYLTCDHELLKKKIKDVVDRCWSTGT